LAYLFGALGPNDRAGAIRRQCAALNIDQGTRPKVPRSRRQVRARRADTQPGHA